jgi:hypothetical protein
MHLPLVGLWKIWALAHDGAGRASIRCRKQGEVVCAKCISAGFHLVASSLDIINGTTGVDRWHRVEWKLRARYKQTNIVMMHSCTIQCRWTGTRQRRPAFSTLPSRFVSFRYVVIRHNAQRAILIILAMSSTPHCADSLPRP